MNATLTALQELDLPTVSTVTLVAAALALVVLEPITGRRHYRDFLTQLERDSDRQGAVRVRFYRRWTLQGWLLGVTTVALVLVLPGVTPADLGLRLPDPSGLDGAPSLVVGALIGIALGALGLLVGFLLRNHLPSSSRTPAKMRPVHPMHPVSSDERRGWAWLSLSAGVTEEITFRGLVVLALATVLTDVDPFVVVAVGAVVFGLAHWYQGRLGMVTTGFLGALFVSLYLSTGSLLLPMALHVLIDVLVLARLAQPTQARSEQLEPA